MSRLSITHKIAAHYLANYRTADAASQQIRRDGLALMGITVGASIFFDSLLLLRGTQSQGSQVVFFGVTAALVLGFHYGAKKARKSLPNNLPARPPKITREIEAPKGEDLLPSNKLLKNHKPLRGGGMIEVKSKEGK